jgi:phenylpyruvate tautomerase PptA (4-oxalocrotonate tautomerase family)
MPLTKIHLRSGRSDADKAAMADAVQAALIEHLGIPEQDRFLLFVEYADQDFRHTPAFLDLTYSAGLIMIEVSFIVGRSDEIKKALIAGITSRIVKATGQRPDDVFIMLYEVTGAGVSFGKGLTQRA